MNEEPLSAKEILLHDEGSQMLNALKSAPPKTLGIVLADGSPATAPAETAPAQVMLTQEEARVRAHEIVAARKLKNAKSMLAILAANPDLKEVQNVIFACYRILFWTRMEMCTHEDVMDDMLADFERYIEQSIYDDPKGYDFAVAVKQMRHGALPIMDKFVRKYQDQGRARAQQLKRMREILGEDGIALPGETFKTVMGKPFVPGMLLVLAGKPEDTAGVMMLLACNAGIKQDLRPHWYSVAEQGMKTPVYHIIEEWKNAAAKMATLRTALNSSMDAENVLLFIEDLESLYTFDDRGFHSTERKAYALNRLFQWAVDSMMAVVVADNIAPEVYDGRFYGHIPSVKVTSRGTSAGREFLINGAPLPISEISTYA